MRINAGGTWKHGTVWINVAGVWKRARCVWSERRWDLEKGPYDESESVWRFSTMISTPKHFLSQGTAATSSRDNRWFCSVLLGGRRPSASGDAGRKNQKQTGCPISVFGEVTGAGACLRQGHPKGWKHPYCIRFLSVSPYQPVQCVVQASRSASNISLSISGNFTLSAVRTVCLACATDSRKPIPRFGTIGSIYGTMFQYLAQVFLCPDAQFLADQSVLSL